MAVDLSQISQTGVFVSTQKRNLLKSYFNNKRILITGASQGIGRELAVQLAPLGAKLFLLSRNEEKLIELQKQLKEAWVQVASVDVSQASKIKEVVKKASHEMEGLDMLINNAGVGLYGSLEKSKLEDLRRVMEVNFWGSVYTTQTALPYLSKSKNGHLVFINSATSFYGAPHMALYSAAKAALHTFCQSLKAEISHTSLKVLEVFPGVIDNQFHDHAQAQTSHPYKKKRLKGGSQKKLVEKILLTMAKKKSRLIYPSYWKIYRALCIFFPFLISYTTTKKLTPDLRRFEDHV